MKPVPPPRKPPSRGEKPAKPVRKEIDNARVKVDYLASLFVLLGSKEEIPIIKEALSKKQLSAETATYIMTELGKPEAQRVIKQREPRASVPFSFDQ